MAALEDEAARTGDWKENTSLVSIQSLAVPKQKQTGTRRSRPVLREIQVKGSGQDEDFEDLAKERGGNPLGGRGLEPEEDHLDYQSRWKRWAADIEFRLAVFESPERGRVKRERERAKGGVGEVLELELEDPDHEADWPKPKAACGIWCSSCTETDSELSERVQWPQWPLAQGEAESSLSQPGPLPEGTSEFSFAQAILEDGPDRPSSPSSSRHLNVSCAEARPALKERSIARWSFERKAPLGSFSLAERQHAAQALALHRLEHALATPLKRSSPRHDLHSRGQQWLEEKRAKEHHLREQHRDLELCECTFQPQIGQTGLAPSRRSRSTGAVVPLQSARSVYDRQLRWQTAVKEKTDRERQRRDEAAEEGLRTELELAKRRSRCKTKGSQPQDVEDAFACFHERNRKWQSMRQARQAQQQQQQLEQLERSPRRASSVALSTVSATLGQNPSTCGTCGASVRRVRKTALEGAETRGEALRGAVDPERSRENEQLELEALEVRKHLGNLRQGLRLTASSSLGAPVWQKALNVEVARLLGAGAAPRQPH